MNVELQERPAQAGREAAAEGAAEAAAGAAPSPPFGVVLASSMPLAAEALAGRIRADGRFRLLAEVTSGDEAVQACQSSRAALLLMGPRVDGLSGAALVRAVRTSCPTAVVVVGDAGDPQEVYDCIAAGAAGFAGGAEAGEAIITKLWRAAHGRINLGPLVDAALVAAVRGRASADDRIPSGRELQMLRMLVCGSTVREMARAIFVSEATAKTYLRRLYYKLGAGDRTSAVAEAMRRGWVS